MEVKTTEYSEQWQITFVSFVLEPFSYQQAVALLVRDGSALIRLQKEEYSICRLLLEWGGFALQCGVSFC